MPLADHEMRVRKTHSSRQKQQYNQRLYQEHGVVGFYNRHLVVIADGLTVANVAIAFGGFDEIDWGDLLNLPMILSQSTLA